MKKTLERNSFNLDKLTSGITGTFGPKPIASITEFYLSGDILEAEEYIAWFDTIRHADENDVIKFYINSGGGNLYTAIQFMRVMADCKGTIVASAEGACMSAATIIFLCADVHEVSSHSVFMFHNYSGGTFGKGGEMIDQLVHERKWTERLFRSVYKDFLNEEEFKSMLEGKDLWMDGDEVVTRITYMHEQEEKELAKQEAEERKAARQTKAKPATKPKAKATTKKQLLQEQSEE